MPTHRKSNIDHDARRAQQRDHRTHQINGRQLEVGDQFTVKGHGRHTYLYTWRHDGSIVASPATDKPVTGRRTFRPDEITTIHRTKKGTR